MNLPSSLALSQSKLFQSRLGILLLALVGVAIAAGLFLMKQDRARRPVTPTPATSPAAQALPKAAPAPKQLVFYGPPAPSWAKPAVPLGPPVPPELALSVMPRPSSGAAAGIGAASMAAPVTPVAAASASHTAPATAPVGGAVKSPVAGPIQAPVAGPIQAPLTSVPAPAAPLSSKAVAPQIAAPQTATSVAPQAATSAARTQAPPLIAVQAPAPAMPTGSAAAAEIPKSVDASVLFARDRYEYVSGGRRDPFQSLIDGKYQGQTADASLIDVGDIHLVGIMWGSSDKFALVEDSRGHGYVLRVGDPVVNGYISGITKNELRVVQNAFGESQALSITMQTKEGDKNATRN